MSNAKCQMSNEAQSSNDKKGRYDLPERTAKFAETVIDFVKTLPENAVTKPLISQLIRAVTSIGANYMEADGAESKKDFKHKIGICKKESKETTFWFRMIARSMPDKAPQCRIYYKEATELTLIFSTIIINCDKKKEPEEIDI